MKTIAAGMIVLAASVALCGQAPAVMPPGQIVVDRTFGFISGQLLGGTVVKGTPYSAQAVTETTQVLADGNRIVKKSTAMVYRDSLGRERREETLSAIGSFVPIGDPPRIILISDPVAGVNYSLNSKGRLAIKLPTL